MSTWDLLLDLLIERCMGMECVRSTAYKYWQPTNLEDPARWMDDTDVNTATSASSPPLSIQSPPSMELDFLPHSAPSTCTLLSGACRRAASFPLANRAFLEGDLHSRSQSESCALNNVSVKVPRTLLQEFHFFKRQQQAAQQIWSEPPLPGGVKFFAPVHEDGGSESDTEEGRMSSSPSSSDEDDHLSPDLEQESATTHALPKPLLLLNNKQLSDNVENEPPVHTTQPHTSAHICSDDIMRRLEHSLEKAKDEVDLKHVLEAREHEKKHLEHSALGKKPEDLPVGEDREVPSTTSSSTSRSSSPASGRRKHPHHHKVHRRPRRAVRFADECGNDLYQLKVLTEPSDYPPAIPRAVIQRHRRAAGLSDLSDEDEKKKPKSTWRIMFNQPASEYIKFRQTLEKLHVALENVIVKNEVPKLVGTIKVGNISFEKRVFIRCTANKWQTFEDFDAKFMTSASKAFDTFTFDLPIPNNIGQSDSRLEFCICYKAGETEYWDSNDGKNYVLEGESLPKPPSSPQPSSPVPRPELLKPLTPAAKQRYSRDDAYRMEYKNWSSFASWKALSTDSPYW